MWRAGPFPRSGLQRYVHIVRAPDDPERSPRSARRGAPTAWRALLADSTRSAWRTEILGLLSDGVPRTFNRITVELGDVTADVALDKAPDQALWDLVADRRIEHTLKEPVMFRLTT